MRNAIEQGKAALTAGAIDESADELFHCLLAQSTQNSVLANMVAQTWQVRKSSAMWQGRIVIPPILATVGNGWMITKKILQAVLRRDSKAAKQAMWQHLENVKLKLLEISDADHPDFDGYLFESAPYQIEE